MGQWPIRNCAYRCHPDNKKARSGAFIYQQSGSGSNRVNSKTTPKEQCKSHRRAGAGLYGTRCLRRNAENERRSNSTNSHQLWQFRSLYPGGSSIYQTSHIAQSTKHPAKNNAEDSETNSQNDNCRNRSYDPLDHEYDHGNEWHLNINDRDLILTVVFHKILPIFDQRSTRYTSLTSFRCQLL